MNAYLRYESAKAVPPGQRGGTVEDVTHTNIAEAIDHTNLSATATAHDIDTLCTQAAQHHFVTVCVNPYWVKRAAANLAGTGVGVCTVVGFPLGATSAKAAETTQAVHDGATEVDMVINIGALKSGLDDDVYTDIADVVAAAGGVPVKVILETCYLSEDEKILACRLAAEAGATYVKTSTGVGTSGATADDVRLLAGFGMKVKASGGVRTRQDAEAMIAAGADRLGTSAGVHIVTDTPAADPDVYFTPAATY